MTYFENSWGYKCPIALEVISDGVRFITAELGEGSGVSASKILIQFFVDKPYSFVSMRNRPCIRIDEIRWFSDNKSCYEVVIEGDFLKVALSVINNGYEPFFAKCIWEVPVRKLTELNKKIETKEVFISNAELHNADYVTQVRQLYEYAQLLKDKIHLLESSQTFTTKINEPKNLQSN